MKIILIGFMGSGKSTLGKLLAQKLKVPLHDTDQILLEVSKRKSIPEIFEKEGETAFREYEIAACRSLRNNQNCVISTGGGIVVNKINLDYLKEQNGRIIFLKTSWKTVLKRVGNSKVRPLMKDKHAAKKLYDFRQNLYEYYADTMIDTNDISPAEIVNEIITKLNYSREVRGH